MARSGERSELTGETITGLPAALDRIAALEETISRALSLTDEDLDCTEWCRGEHCLYVIETYRTALRG